MERSESNPYDFVNPIRVPEYFAGRHQELKEAEYYLSLSTGASPKYFHLALVGSRSVGKTSLLNMITRLADDLGFLTVKVPLNSETVKSDVLFFKEILDGLVTRGAERGLYGGISGAIYKAFRKAVDILDVQVEIPFLFGTAYIGHKKGLDATVPQHVLIHDFKEIQAEAKKNKIPTIVLLFDECDLLALNEAVLQKIRNIFMELEGYVLVFSGTEKMYPKIADIFSPIPRFFKRINVENFKDPKDSEECLLKPLSEEEKKAFDQACIGEIHQITNGSPYEINLIAHFMYRRWKEGKNVRIGLSPEVLDDVLNEIERLRSTGHYEIANRIRNSWPDQLRVLMAVLEFPQVSVDWLSEYMLLDEIDTLQPGDAHVKKFITKDYVQHFQKDGILASEDEKIVFKGDTFDILYLKYLVASKGLKEVRTFFVGFSNDPPTNLHHKLVEGVLLRDFSEYQMFTSFDKRERIDGKTGQRFLIGAKVNVPPGIHKILEFSPRTTTNEFYLGVPNSLRFRVNVEWMEEGFVTQFKFKTQEDVDKLRNRVTALENKLESLGYKILLKDEIAWNNEGTHFSAQGKFDEALRCFNEALKINPSFELPWANKAGIFLSLQKYDEALESANKALELSSGWSDILRLKGIVLINLKRNEEALECLERATKINPEDWSSWDNKGRALLNLSKLEEAVQAFDRTLKLNQKNHEVSHLKGLALLALGREDEALGCFGEALRIRPDYAPSLIFKGQILFRRKDYNGALACCEIILAKEEQNPEALTLKAVALSVLGNHKDARDICDSMIVRDQGNATAWYNKACFESRLGNSDEALRSLKKAVELNKDFIEQAKTEDDFATLRTDTRFQNLIGIRK